MRNTIVRRGWSNLEERAKTIAEFRASGLTQREFVGRAGMSLSSLQKWLRDDRKPVDEMRFLELAPGQPASNNSCKVHFPHGLTLEIPQGFPTGELKNILAQLCEI